MFLIYIYNNKTGSTEEYIDIEVAFKKYISKI